MIRYISDGILLISYIFAAYLTFISLFGILRPKKAPKASEHLRFAALIPARNEEACISGIVESLLRQNYPADKLDIYVIPNNCTDDTAGAALRAGARIIRPRSGSGKGAALRCAIGQLLDHYDAFCVFDADNEINRDFVSSMNRALTSGARVAKSRIFAKNRLQNWVCGCYEIYFCFANRFLNRARSVLHMSVRVIGTGFAVRSDLLRENGGWTFESITEDADFFAFCASRGEKIVWCGDAVTYDEEPTSFKASVIQRKRWVSGILQVTRSRIGQLLGGLFHRKSAISSLDAMMQMFFCLVQAFLPFALLLSLLNNPVSFLAALPRSLLTGYSAAILSALGSLILEKRFTVKMIPAVLMYPIFMVSFIPLQTLALFHRTTKWCEIHHTGIRCAETERAA